MMEEQGMGKRAEMDSVPQHSAPTAARGMHTAQDGWRDSWEEAAEAARQSCTPQPM